MSKQDRQGVRTAQDLERKYNFSAMKKAIELHESGIFKTNKTLEDFINAVMRNFMEMKSELDTKAEIWFYSGAPSLENEPASTWEDYSLHLGDLYYDTATGYGYRFKGDAWEQIMDQDTIYALALANSAKDTDDNVRSVFITQPIPPYSTGDLWLDDEFLYVCQIAKTEGEFEKQDFISADKYADDTVTLQIGDVLNMIVEGGRVATELVLTDRMINAITDKFVVTAPNGTTTVIKGGEMFLDAIFSQNINATGTITGATLKGTNAEIDEGMIGGFNLLDKELVVELDGIYISPGVEEAEKINAYVVGGTTLTDLELEAFDINGDGNISVSDARLAQDIARGVRNYTDYNAKPGIIKVRINPKDPEKLICINGTTGWGKPFEHYFGVNGLSGHSVKVGNVFADEIRTSAGIDLNELAARVAALESK